MKVQIIILSVLLYGVCLGGNGFAQQSTFQGYGSDSLQVRKYYEEALILLDSAEYDQAIEYLDSALSISPFCLECIYNKAVACNGVKEFNQAISNLEQIEKYIATRWDRIDPFWNQNNLSHAFNFQLGMTYLYLNNKWEAIKYLKNALTYNESDSFIQSLIATVYRDLGDLENAVSYYRLAISNDPNDQSSWFNLGTIYLKNDQYDVALKYFTKCIEIDPSFLNAYYNRSLIKLKFKDYKGAVDDLNKVIGPDSTNTDAMFNRSKAYRGLFKLEEAYLDLTKVMQIVPYSIEANNLLIEYLTEAENYEAIVIVYDRLIAHYGKTKELLYGRGSAKILDKQNGCDDLRNAADLGNVKAFELIRIHCNK